MKTTLSFVFDTLAEAHTFLNGLGGEHKVTVAAEATTAKPVEKVEAPKTLEDHNKAELKALCDGKGLAYTGKSTKADLISLLTHGPAQVVEQVPVEAAPVAVPQDLTPAPAAVTTPVAQPAITPEVAAPAVDNAHYIEQYKAIYNTAEVNGVAGETLVNIIKTELANVGHAETKISALPITALIGFIQGFQAQVNALVAQPAPTQGGFL